MDNSSEPTPADEPRLLKTPLTIEPAEIADSTLHPADNRTESKPVEYGRPVPESAHRALDALQSHLAASAQADRMAAVLTKELREELESRDREIARLRAELKLLRKIADAVVNLSDADSGPSIRAARGAWAEWYESRS